MGKILNGDMPAIPAAVSDDFGIATDAFGTQYTPGMTKREFIAMHAMQGFITKNNGYTSVKDCVESSIEMADELLKALEDGV